MDFLSNAIISAQNSEILGALITHFDPSNYQSRSSMRLYSTADLIAEKDKLDPRGFMFQSPGTLLSDTTVMRSVTDSVFSYMEEECSKLGDRTLDITDLVLRGVDVGGCVFANYEQLNGEVAPEELADKGIFVPFKNFRVSNSSFNIYASYQDEADNFKTCSLLKLEDGSAQKFFAVFPSTVDMSDFPRGVMPYQNIELGGVPHVVYEINLGLNGFYASVGEGFLNFLSYNIAFYNIGEKLMKEIRVVMPKVPEIPVEEQAPRVYRKAKVNVSIQHIYKESRLKGIVGCMGDNESLISFIRDFPEAAISYQWLQKIYSSPWYAELEGKKPEEECVYAACTNLLSMCRQERLKYAIELLTHRYYIYMLGIVNDTLGPVLKGGGVEGESLKRVSF